MARPTIRDIAHEAGVSTTAVSFALNGRPGVSAATRERIRTIADRLGWSPSATARALSSSKANAIGLVIQRPHSSYSSERFFFDFILGVQGRLALANVDLLLHFANNADEESAIHRTWWAERKIDAIIVVDPRVDDPRPRQLAAMGVPTVVVGEEASECSAVIGDDSGLIRALAAHLVDVGARRIGFVCGFSSFMHTQRRITALSRYGTEKGIDVMISAETDYTEEAGHQETSRLLDSPIAPNAFIFDNEVLAIGGIQAITDHGLKLGKDILAVSCEGSPVCRILPPGITSTDRAPASLGEHAAELLLESLGGNTSRTLHEPVPQVIVRGSTRPRTAAP